MTLPRGSFASPALARGECFGKRKPESYPPTSPRAEGRRVLISGKKKICQEMRGPNQNLGPDALDYCHGIVSPHESSGAVHQWCKLPCRFAFGEQGGAATRNSEVIEATGNSARRKARTRDCGVILLPDGKWNPAGRLSVFPTISSWGC